MNDNSEVLKKARERATKLINEKVPSEYVFHDLKHTEQVAEYSEEIGRANLLNEEELEIVKIAAWFHDTGYTEKYEKNEQIGARLAEEFLREIDYPEEKIEKVKGCILATKVPQNPQNLLEQVVCDADLANLGKKSFFKRNELIREELKSEKDFDLEDEIWYKGNIEFLKDHKYHTDYAKAMFNKRKKKNIKKLKQMIDIDDAAEAASGKKSNKGKNSVYVIKDASDSSKRPPDRGIETMFRNNLRGHLALSAIADNKANIMLSMNAIILSIILTVLAPALNTNAYLALPTLFLIAVCVTTIIFATLSTIPKVTKGVFSREDIENKTANLLFFGNFHNMDVGVFEWGIKEMMKDRDFLYGSMTRDFYYLGTVLDKKYRYLRWCYRVFMFGLIAAVIAFVVAYLTNA